MIKTIPPCRTPNARASVKDRSLSVDSLRLLVIVFIFVEIILLGGPSGLQVQALTMKNFIGGNGGNGLLGYGKSMRQRTIGAYDYYSPPSKERCHPTLRTLPLYGALSATQLYQSKSNNIHLNNRPSSPSSLASSASMEFVKSPGKVYVFAEQQGEYM